MLRVLATISLCFPLVLYISVQFHSLGSLASQLTNGNLNFYAVVAVCVVLCLAFEFLGGMRSVAYTDAVESVVMIFIFVIIPIILLFRRGGFAGQLAFGDAQCSNSQEQLSGNETELIGCVNYVKDASGISNFFYSDTVIIKQCKYVDILSVWCKFPCNSDAIAASVYGKIGFTCKN